MIFFYLIHLDIVRQGTTILSRKYKVKYFRNFGNQDKKQRVYSNKIGILIHKEISIYIKIMKAISERIFLITLQLNNGTSLKFIPLYVPTSHQEDWKVEAV